MSAESARVMYNGRELVRRGNRCFEIGGKPVDMSADEALSLPLAPPTRVTVTATSAAASPAKPRQARGPRLGFIAQQVAASA